MKIGLYVNVLLTGDPALKSEGLVPIYPRRSCPLDACDKVKVLKLSFDSIVALPISKIILNIEANGDFENAVEGIRFHVQECFPNAEIVKESKRPTTLEAWHDSTNFAESFFGTEMPILCFFNHDHIFVDFRHEPFIQCIETVFSDSNNLEAYIIYSHAPEAISMSYDSQAYLSRLRCVPGMKINAAPCLPVNDLLFKTTVYNHQDGIFVTTTAGLRKMWSKVISATDYMPRPDWPGVIFEDAKFEIFYGRREFFRHFDGYGHITTLRNSLALDLVGFGSEKARIPRHIPRAFGGSQSKLHDHDLTKEADSYTEIFFDNYCVAARDALFAQLFGLGQSKNGKQLIEDLFSLFSKAYLENQGELDHLSESQRHHLASMVMHRISSSANIFYRDLLADCSFWNPFLSAKRSNDFISIENVLFLRKICTRILRKIARLRYFYSRR